MVLNLITLGIKFILKTYFQKIKILRIKLLTKSKKFRGHIDKLIIEAEDIIYKDFYFKNAIFEGFNLSINFSKNKKIFNLNDFQAQTTLYLTSENIKNIINKNCSDINKEIKEFVVQNLFIRDISFDNQLINFYISNEEENFKFTYELIFENNNLILKKCNSKKYLLIPFDENISFKGLSFNKDYLKLKLKSRVKLETKKF